MTRTEAISGTVLVVAPCAVTDGVVGDPAFEEAGLTVERAADPDQAIKRVEEGGAIDVILLAPRLADPVRVAQRLHSLDRQGAVIVLAEPAGEADLLHALEVAPFLDGDVTMAVMVDAPDLAELVAAAAARTRDRRAAAATLKKRRATPPPLSARYLGTLLDSVPIGLVTLDAGGAVIGWNKRTGQMMESAEVEALGQHFAELFGEADRPRLERLIERFGSAGFEGEAEIFTRDQRSFEITGARFTIRSGERGTLLILQEVTKRLAAERELELHQALMAAQADSSLLGIAVVSLDGTLERMNKRWTQIWGVDAELIRADRDRATQIMLDQVVEPDEFVRGGEYLASTDGGDFRDEVALKDGRVIERYATHVRDDAGEVLGRIWFHTDITAHRREEDALRFLADATNVLSSSLEYETTLQRVADLAVPRIADWCTVEIVQDEGGHATVAIAHQDEEKIALARDFRKRYPDVESGAVGSSVSNRESLVFAKVTDEQITALAQNDEHLSLLRALAIRSAMIVPIKVRDRVYGTINFIRSQGAGYDAEDLALAEELARRAAIAIDNSRVHAELRETARTLQESLLPPHLPAVKGLELAARFRPAGAGIQVGGDFYDVFDTGPEKWGIAVGDVCGKGAEAAALTALTRYTVRVAAMYEDDARGVLRVLNEALLHQRGDYRFTTLAYCMVDLSSNPATLTAACGGHPRPLILRANGRTETTGGAGPLLGVLPAAEFTEERVELFEGDVIVLYTDGLTDALAPERMLTEASLLETLDECQAMSAGEISHRLEMVALGGDHTRVPRDDIAIVVAKVG